MFSYLESENISENARFVCIQTNLVMTIWQEHDDSTILRREMNRDLTEQPSGGARETSEVEENVIWKLSREYQIEW